PTPTEVVIAVQAPMTGPNARTGQDMWDAAVLAAEEWNEKGGVLGRKIRLVRADTESDVTKGVEAVRRTIVEEEAEAVVGCYHSSIGIAIAEVVHEYGVPYVDASCVSNTITETMKGKPYPEVFQYSPTSVGLGTTAADYLLHFYPDVERVVLIFEAAEWVKPALDAFEKKVKKELPDVQLKRWIHEFMATDLYVELTAAKAFKPEFIFHGQTGVAVPAFIKQLREMGITGVKGSVGIGTLYTSDEIIKLGITAEAEGFTGETQFAFTVPMTEKFFPFLDKFNEKHGRTPLYSGCAEYDAMYVYLHAVEAAKTTEPASVIEALKKTDFIGIKGRITFDEMQRTPIPWTIMQWQNGELKVVWPLEIAEVEPIPLTKE
ncbi:MAG: ABC transporter substrate-binding protein, partial [Candidatus Geothermarchaeales archaeon]